jgi:glycopeptide antibiotics resistance protein
MGNAFKKIAVILPVFVLSWYYLSAQYSSVFRHASEKRLWALALSVLLLYAWIIIAVIRRKQDSVFQWLLQSSFYVYVFMVLTLTGYFIFFRELSSHGWWQDMTDRVHAKNHVNLVPWQVFKIYKLTDKQVVGNFVMLLPLGIYLPLMYNRIKGFFPVVLISMLVSIAIELMQLATSYRSTDVDDVILNTSGAVVGYILYAIGKGLRPKV